MKKKIKKVVTFTILWILLFSSFLICIILASKYAKDRIYKKEDTYIYFENEPYKEKELIQVLFIGIDKFGSIESTESYNNTYQADFLTLLTLDKKNQSYRLLQINRDTMVDIDILSIRGDRTGNKIYGQVALSYNYGDGTIASALNTKRAVARMLYNIDIDYYITMSMDAVGVLTEILGGVEILFDEDYTEINPKYQKGEQVLLTKKEALEFVRVRMTVEDGTNIKRMKRQKIFMEAFLKVFKEKYQNAKIEDFAKILKENQTEENIYFTNASSASLSSIANNLLEYDFLGMYSLAGSANYDKKFVEFYLDLNWVEEYAKNNFFEKVKE